MTLSIAGQILSGCAVYALLVAWVAHDRRRADRRASPPAPAPCRSGFTAMDGRDAGNAGAVSDLSPTHPDPQDTHP